MSAARMFSGSRLPRVEVDELDRRADAGDRRLGVGARGVAGQVDAHVDRDLGLELRVGPVADRDRRAGLDARRLEQVADQRGVDAELLHRRRARPCRASSPAGPRPRRSAAGARPAASPSRVRSARPPPSRRDCVRTTSRKRSVTWPSTISSPWRSAASRTRSPLTITPLRLRSSRTTVSSPRRVTTAWRRDTDECSSITVALVERPRCRVSSPTSITTTSSPSSIAR